MKKVAYLDWENILLDTTIIYNYIRALRDDTDPKCNFVKRVIDDLVSRKTKKKKSRQFYISAISISEMYGKIEKQSQMQKIVSKMKIDSLTCVAFDEEIAEFMTQNYHAVLGTEKLKPITRELCFPEHDLLLAREWITKDLMIIATSHFMKCDVALTTDARTFEPMASKVDCFSALVLEENFNVSTSGKNIFEYSKTKKDDENKKSKRTQKRTSNEV